MSKRAKPCAVWSSASGRVLYSLVAVTLMLGLSSGAIAMPTAEPASEPPAVPIRVIAEGDAIPANGALLIDPGSFAVERVEVVDVATGQVVPGMLIDVLGIYLAWQPSQPLLPEGSRYFVSVFAPGVVNPEPVEFTSVGAWSFPPPPLSPLAMQVGAELEIFDVNEGACCGAGTDDEFCFDLRVGHTGFLHYVFAQPDPSYLLNQFVFSLNGAGALPWPLPDPVGVPTNATDPYCISVGARHIITGAEYPLGDACVSLEGVPALGVMRYSLDAGLTDMRCLTPPPGYEVVFCEAKATCSQQLDAPGCEGFAAHCMANGVGEPGTGTPPSVDFPTDTSTDTGPLAGAPAPAPSTTMPTGNSAAGSSQDASEASPVQQTSRCACSAVGARSPRGTPWRLLAAMGALVATAFTRRLARLSHRIESGSGARRGQTIWRSWLLVR